MPIATDLEKQRKINPRKIYPVDTCLIAAYLARHLEAFRPEEASATRVLRELVKNQRLG